MQRTAIDEVITPVLKPVFIGCRWASAISLTGRSSVAKLLHRALDPVEHAGIDTPSGDARWPASRETTVIEPDLLICG